MNPVIPPAPSLLQMLLGLYGFLLPLVLYVVWSTLALWDLGRRRDARAGTVWAWTLAVFLLPFAGALGYLVTAGGTLSRPLRLAAIVGGVAVYGLVLIVGAGIGGIS